MYVDSKWDCHHCWVCLDEELVSTKEIHILGAVGLKPCSYSDTTNQDNTVEIGYFFVAANSRRKGIGRTLLRLALEYARSVPTLHYVKLLTLNGIYESACKLYYSEGFQIYREQDVPFYKLLFMQLDIKPTV